MIVVTGNVGFLPMAIRMITGKLSKGARIGMKISARNIVDRARTKHAYTSRTGMLTRSIQVKTPEPIFERGEFIMKVWLDPRFTATDSVGTYGVFQHEGTGQHTGGYIYPKNADKLHFFMNGREYFRRRVRGIKPDPFLYRAGAELEQQTVRTIREHMQGEVNT